MSSTTPRISVIVPTHRRPAPLQRCLQALARQDAPAETFELIVVDDGGGVTPAELAAAAPHAPRLVRRSQGGPAAARNSGAGEARGTVLAFTDDDCEPAPGWVSALGARFPDEAPRMVGGRTVNALPHNPCAEASQLVVDYLCRSLNAGGAVRFLTANNMAVTAAEFARVGGFDASFPLPAGEERDLCARWREVGLPIEWASDAVVAHGPDLHLAAFWRQHSNYGRGARRLRRLLASRRREARLAPPAVYLGLLTEPWRRTSGLAALRLAVLVALSQVAVAAGVLTERVGAPGWGGARR